MDQWWFESLESLAKKVERTLASANFMQWQVANLEDKIDAGCIYTRIILNVDTYTSTACPDIHIGICKTPSQPCKQPAIISFPPWPPWPCLFRPGCFRGPWLVLCVNLGFGKGFNQEPAKVDFFHIFSRPKNGKEQRKLHLKGSERGDLYIACMYVCTGWICNMIVLCIS